MNKIYYIKMHYMSFDDPYKPDLDISIITPIDTGFSCIEDARKCLNEYLSNFAKIRHRNSKIVSGLNGFTVDFYDDKDYIVETYNVRIRTMHIR